MRKLKGAVNEATRTENLSKSGIRADVEHVFCVVKRLRDLVRYRSLAKRAPLSPTLNHMEKSKNAI